MSWWGEGERACPTLPLVQHVRRHKCERIMAMLRQYLNGPADPSVLKKLLQHVPLVDQRAILGNMVLFLLQKNSNVDDERILGILTVCPQAATFVDNEMMNAVHYVCMRQITDDMSVLFTLLELYPNLSRLQNKFGESPLHQLVGQNRPDPRVVQAIVKMCPEAFRETINYKEGGRLPVHVIMLNSRLHDDASVAGCMRLCIDAFPLGMFITLREERLALRVNGPAVRVTHAWTPYEKAKKEFPKVFDCIEKKVEEVALQRTIPYRGGNFVGYHRR